MDVAGPLGHRPLQDGVDQADGGGAGLVVPQLVGGKGAVRGVLGVAVGGGLPLHVGDGLGRALAAVEDLDGVLHAGAGGHHGHDPVLGGQAGLLDGVEVQRVAHGQEELILHHPDGHHLVLLGDGLWHHLGHLGGDGGLGQVDELDTQLHLKHFDQLLLGDHAAVDQHRADARLGLLLHPQGVLQLFPGDASGGDQQLTQLYMGHGKDLLRV